MPEPIDQNDAFLAYLYHQAYDVLSQSHRLHWTGGSAVIFAKDRRYTVTVAVSLTDTPTPAGAMPTPERRSDGTPIVRSAPTVKGLARQAIKVLTTIPQSPKAIAIAMRRRRCSPHLYGVLRRLREQGLVYKIDDDLALTELGQIVKDALHS